MGSLRDLYNKKIMQEVQREMSLSSIMAVPRIEKIIVNAGVGEAVQDKSVIDEYIEILSQITGQKPVVNKAKKAIASFKIRAGMEIGVSVTLRGGRMWDFLEKLIAVVIPRVKDFHGYPLKSFDGHGNYSIGFSDHIVFPEIDPNKVQKLRAIYA